MIQVACEGDEYRVVEALKAHFGAHNVEVSLEPADRSRPIRCRVLGGPGPQAGCRCPVNGQICET